MQTRTLMKIAKSIKRAFMGVKGAVIALPAIPYVMTRRRRRSLAASVFGGIGFAVLGGIAAMMFFSPRTRHRALHAAKDTYGKVNETFHRLRPERTTGVRMDEIPVSNGPEADYPTTSGL